MVGTINQKKLKGGFRLITFLTLYILHVFVLLPPLLFPPSISYSSSFPLFIPHHHLRDRTTHFHFQLKVFFRVAFLKTFKFAMNRPFLLYFPFSLLPLHRSLFGSLFYVLITERRKIEKKKRRKEEEKKTEKKRKKKHFCGARFFSTFTSSRER